MTNHRHLGIIPNHARRARAVARTTLVLCGALAACDQKGDGRRTEASGDVAPQWNPGSARAIQGVTTADVTSAIELRLASLAQQRKLPEGERRVRALYTEYHNSPLWLDSGGLNDRARALVNALAEVPSHGLRLDEYPVDSLRTALTMLRDNRQPTAEQLAVVDVLFTRTFVTLVHDLLVGQVSPRSVSQDWHIDPHEERVDSAIARTLSTPQLEAALASARPTNPDYDALRREKPPPWFPVGTRLPQLHLWPR